MANKRLILERTAHAIRKQDWFAVAIEFTLVVAGVLLAFQINEWANEREERQERSAATIRLLDEAEETVAYFRAGVQAQQQLVNDLDYALRAVDGRRWQDADRARITRGLSQVNVTVPPAPPSSIYDDLVASGRIGSIGDTELRTSIANYWSTLRFYQRFTDYIRQSMPAFEDFRALKYRYRNDNLQRMSLSVDLPALAGDELLQEKLAITARWQNISLGFRKRLLAQAVTMCSELARMAERPCKVPERASVLGP
ncbi:MAG TPA: hypothetical protein VJ597_03645 [Sphingomicrobium sp.]|nr:hypothetical protein [Sphingomicrobium sp.]